MCFDHDAAPPELPADLRRPPLAGGAPGERIGLSSADGTAFSGFVASREDDGAGVVVIPDVRGHSPFYEQLCDRFAEAGHPAITFDPFGRTAGLGPRDDDFDYWPEVVQTTTNAEIGLEGAVGFYGALDGTRLEAPSPKDTSSASGIPVLGLFGGADDSIPEEHRAAFARGLEASGVEHDVVVYPGAPHSFFDRKAEEFADASEDAWRRTLAFLAAQA